MAGVWPTPGAKAALPRTAALRNAVDKVVFSSTLTEATWANAELWAGDPAGPISGAWSWG